MNTPVDSVRFDRDAVAVELGTGRVLRGSVLIAADGAESPIRKMVGIRYLGRDYGQQALVSHVATELPHEEIAWQRFLEGGPLAFLPLSDGRSSIVWSLPNSDAQELIAASDGRLLEALQVASGGVLGSIEAVGERALFRLRARHALRYTRPRLALAGDAAHSVHPLAGQGMNLGLLDADLLAAVIGRAAESGEDPGDLRTIRRYERGRKADNLGMLLALDAIDLTFRMPRWFTPFSAAGLEVVDRSGLAKEVLMRHALGVSGLGRHAA